MHRQRESFILYIDQTTIENTTDIRCFDMIDGLICQSSLCFMLIAAFPSDMPTPDLLNCMGILIIQLGVYAYGMQLLLRLLRILVIILSAGLGSYGQRVIQSTSIG